MGFPAGLDLDLLRSFVVIAEEWSFTQAAKRVGRSQSAVSLQMPSWVEECLGRAIAMRALEQSGRNHRVVSTSVTTAGQLAAVLAGLAVIPSMVTSGLPEGLRPVRAGEGLPGLPGTSFLMLKAREPRQPATDLLAAQIQEVFGADAE